jgi:WD40 repeat protein
MCLKKKVSRDANFSVAWNHTSEKFAVSSQDGSVHVWDIRSHHPLARFSGLHVRFDLDDKNKVLCDCLYVCFVMWNLPL